MPSDQRRRFPRADRLRRRAEFQRVYSQGVRVAGRHMVLFALPTEGPSRFGVTASRKVGNAVVRSRCRRRLRELYRLRAANRLTRRVDLVANARRSCARVPWSALVDDFDDCLKRLEGITASHGAPPRE